MTDFRVLLYRAMVQSPELTALVTDDDGTIRILSASAIEDIPHTPFISFRMHTDFPLERGLGRREYCQVWANDTPGDYLQVDQILTLIRQAVEAIPSQEDFLEARWIETGVDLRDDAMGTINRYIRFQFTGTLRERN